MSDPDRGKAASNFHTIWIALRQAINIPSTPVLLNGYTSTKLDHISPQLAANLHP